MPPGSVSSAISHATAGGDVNATTNVFLYKPPLAIVAPFQAPGLPPRHVDRPAVTEELVAHLLHTSPVDSASCITALHAMGGAGKTVVAASLAHNGRVRQEFVDGVYWATVGQEPDLLAILREWIFVAGDEDFQALDVNTASTHLRTLLHRRRCLFVLDDVWDAEHARPLLAAGRHSHVLLTTRRNQVADDLGTSSVVKLRPMNSTEAIALLGAGTSWAGAASLLEGLARAVGYLPLGLQLLGALLRRGYRAKDLLAGLDQSKDFSTGDAALERRLEASVDLSLTYLRKRDEKLWTRFLKLGILRRGANVTENVLRHLWELDERGTRLTLHALADDALLQTAESPISLHEVLYDVARRRVFLPLPEGLGVPAEKLNRQLLDGYKTAGKHADWFSIPDDYLRGNLVWHLLQGKRLDEADQLVRTSTREGKNAWFQLKLETGNESAYLNDVQELWRAAHNESVLQIQPSIRYAFIVSSLLNRTVDLPSEVPAIMLERDIWPPYRALNVALRLRYQMHEGLVELLAVLARHPAKFEARTVQVIADRILGIARQNGHLLLLAALARYFPEREQSLLETCVPLISNRGAGPLRDLIPFVRPRFHQLIVGRLSHHSELSTLEKWLDLLRKSRMDDRPTLLLAFADCGLVEGAQRGVVREVLAAGIALPAKWLEDGGHLLPPGASARAAELQLLAERAAVAQNERERQQAIQAQETYWRSGRPDLLRLMAKYLPTEVVEKLVSREERSGDEPQQAEAAFALAPYTLTRFPAGLFDRLKGQVVGAERFVSLARMVSEVSEAIQAGKLHEFVTATTKLYSEWWVVEALTESSNAVSDAKTLEILLRATAHFAATDLERRMVSRIAKRMLKCGFFDLAIAAPERLGDKRGRDTVLGEVVSGLAVLGEFERAVSALSTILDVEAQSEAAARVTMYLVCAGRVAEARSLQVPHPKWRKWVDSNWALWAAQQGPPPVWDVVDTSAAAAEQVDIAGEIRQAAEKLLRNPDLPQAVALAEPEKLLPFEEKLVPDFWNRTNETGLNVLEQLASRGRARLLGDIAVAAPVIAASDKTAPNATLTALDEVCTWWP